MRRRVRTLLGGRGPTDGAPDSRVASDWSLLWSADPRRRARGAPWGGATELTLARHFQFGWLLEQLAGPFAQEPGVRVDHELRLFLLYLFS